MRTCKTGNSYEAANRLFTVRKDAMKRAGDDENGSAWHAEQVLEYLRQLRTRTGVWLTLPGEVDRWWRLRAGLRIAGDGARSLLTGSHGDSARLAFASLEDGRLAFRFGESS